jgi:hypothetical protein
MGTSQKLLVFTYENARHHASGRSSSAQNVRIEERMLFPAEQAEAK